MIQTQVNKIREYEGHRQAIYTLSPSNKPGHFLSAGGEGLIAEWQIGSEDGTSIASTSGPIYSMKLVASRDLLIVGHNDGTLYFIDMKTRETIKAFKTEEKAIFDILPFNDDSLIVTSSEGGVLAVWDLEELKFLHQQRLSASSVRTLSLGPDGQSIFAGCSDNNIYRFDLNLRQQQKIEGHYLSVFRIVASPFDGKLYSTGRDAHIRVWDPEQDYQQVNEVASHMYAVNDLIFHPEENYFFTGSMDKSIKVWNGQDHELLKVIDMPRYGCHINGVNRLLWVEDQLLSCGDDRKIMSWKIDFK